MPMKEFPHFKQLDKMNCGPTCLSMVAKFNGRSYSTSELRNKSLITHESLPLGYNTKVGANRVGLSQGQKQRSLVARACKDPEFIFFDRATSALDENNEKIIMENLNEFFYGKLYCLLPII
jgi:ABC-type bacteriocin/lantibiotic exporter with double-glycine peptidase domain